jgi:serine/threonine protein phosphatase PrpC
LFFPQPNQQGILSVSRAFGDFTLEPYIIVDPFISQPIVLSDETPNGYLILACDGLWDVVTDEEATELIKSIPDATLAAEKLR